MAQLRMWSVGTRLDLHKGSGGPVAQDCPPSQTTSILGGAGRTQRYPLACKRFSQLGLLAAIREEKEGLGLRTSPEHPAVPASSCSLPLAVCKAAPIAHGLDEGLEDIGGKRLGE